MTAARSVLPDHAVRSPAPHSLLHLPRPPHHTTTYCGVRIALNWTVAPARPRPSDDRCHTCWGDPR